VDALIYSDSLKELTLHLHRNDKFVLGDVARLIKSSNTLTRAYIDVDTADENECALFAGALSENKSVSALTIEVQQDSHIHTALTKILHNNAASSLARLDMRWCELTGDKAVLVMAALSTNTSLVELTVSVLEESLLPLAHALRHNTGIRKLRAYDRNYHTEDYYLDDYEWEDMLEAAPLLDALCENSSVQQLYLYGFHPGPEGMSALARMLCVNTILRSLPLQYLFYDGTETCEEVVEILKSGKNTILESLSWKFDVDGKLFHFIKTFSCDFHRKD
jgi:hypothetical protein